MATKTILIETDAYALLAREKRDCTEYFFAMLLDILAVHSRLEIDSSAAVPARELEFHAVRDVHHSPL